MEKEAKSKPEHIPPFRFHILTPLYDLLCNIVGMGAGFKKSILASTRIRDGKSIIDIGCGTGVLAVEAKSMFPNSEVIAIDPDNRAVAIAKMRAKRKGADVDFLISGAENLPFKNSSFDFAISTLAFHHMPASVKIKAMRETLRVIKPGGTFYLFDFKPGGKNLLSKLLVFFEAEHVKDNFEGRIHTFLKEAGFKKINVLHEKYGLFEMIEARKI